MKKKKDIKIDKNPSLADRHDELLYDIANSLKSTRFILAVLTVIPSMTFFGYALVSIVEAKDRLIILGMINAILLMVLTFYFSEKLQNGNKKE